MRLAEYPKPSRPSMLALVGRPRPDSRQIFIYCYLFMFVNAKCYILFAILRRLSAYSDSRQISTVKNHCQHCRPHNVGRN